MLRALATEWLGLRANSYLRRAAVVAVTLLCSAEIAVGQSEPIKGSAVLSAQNGFARLVLTLDSDSEPEANVVGNVLVARFKRKAQVALDGIAGSAPEYVGAVRRDPDGMGIRFALQRKVTLHTVALGERTYIDLLPEEWSGAPPGLPLEIVRELAERARTAERALRLQRGQTAPKPPPPIRVRASQQPKSLRFTFDLPANVSATSAIEDRKLTVSFNAPLSFDLGDAKTVSSSKITAITPKLADVTSAVEMMMIGPGSELRAFREDQTYVVELLEAQSVPVQQIEQSAAAQLPKPPPADHQDAETAAEIPAGDKAAASNQSNADARAQAAASRTRTPTPVASKQDQSPSAAPASQPSELSGLQVTPGSDVVRIVLPVPTSVPMALFRRRDKVWLVIDGEAAIDPKEIVGGANGLITDAQIVHLDRATGVRIRLKRPLLPSLSEGEQGWIVSLAEISRPSTTPLVAVRNISDPRHATVTVMLPGNGHLHRLLDPEDGEVLQVVTALAPVRAVMRRQTFVEFALLETVHGLAIDAKADDLAVELTPQRVLLDRPGGLVLSPDAATRAGLQSGVLFSLHDWQENQKGLFADRLGLLMTALANAAPADRANARVEVARFYIARGFYSEAKGILDGLLGDETTKDNPVVLTLHALASTLAGFPDLALKDVAKLSDDANPDKKLWTAMALARQSKWSQARENFQRAGGAIAALPIDLQRLVQYFSALASLETGEIAAAAAGLNELDLLDIADGMKPSVAVLRGRVAQALGRDEEASFAFRFAAGSSDRQASTDAQLWEIALQQKRGAPVSDTMLQDLETLAITWRGDSFELRALQMLTKVYGATGRFHEALEASRSATRLQPNSEIARQAQDHAAELFTQLYLTPKGNAVPPIEALATFYEYPELTPIGRQGDELIRRLADRLVAVDLLDQAGELLQYQIDNRLDGAARAQVAAKLATIYLMNRKPQRAIAALQSSRLAELSGELRQQRLLLEARGQSDIGRRDLALDIISNVAGKEAIRLRSDIHWAARRWREASEQIELYLEDRWRDFTPLNAIEKGDVLRAAIGYTLADDTLGQARFREKFAPLMASAEDSAMLQVASQPTSARSQDLAQVVKLAASVDTLDGFVRDMKARFQETSRAKPQTDPATTGTLPRIVGSKRASVEQ